MIWYLFFYVHDFSFPIVRRLELYVLVSGSFPCFTEIIGVPHKHCNTRKLNHGMFRQRVYIINFNSRIACMGFSLNCMWAQCPHIQHVIHHTLLHWNEGEWMLSKTPPDRGCIIILPKSRNNIEIGRGLCTCTVLRIHSFLIWITTPISDVLVYWMCIFEEKYIGKYWGRILGKILDN